MIGNSLYPLSNSPRRSNRASTLKSSRPKPRLIATSHRLAALKKSSLSVLSIKVRACFERRLGSPAAQRRNRAIVSTLITREERQCEGLVVHISADMRSLSKDLTLPLSQAKNFLTQLRIELRRQTRFRL